MNNIKIRKDYGFFYDLILIFVLRFNKKFFMKEYMNPNKLEGNTEFYNKLYDEYSGISSELLPFFYMRDKNNRCFLSKLRSLLISENAADERDIIEIAYDLLLDTDKIKIQMLNHYFPTSSASNIEDNSSFIQLADKCLKGSDCEDSLKSALYSFFINPKEVLCVLIEELKAVQLSLTEKWHEAEDELNSFLSDFDYTDFINMINNHGHMDIKENEGITICPCLIAKNSFVTILESNYIFIVGLDYKDLLIPDNSPIKLDDFGNAVAEKNRIAILNVILEAGELSIKEIEEKLKLTGTNIYYHLSLMMKSHMLKSRNIGKSVYYSINKMYFSALIKLLEKYK